MRQFLFFIGPAQADACAWFTIECNLALFCVMRLKLRFQLNGVECQFLGLITAPENSSLSLSE
jgi:hypothetical protein